ncbi:hypothetical protein [Nocardiopsis sp. FIRDI 009]|uniref:hypothetical protein n=1 Tax=Nocardiopsis sp. FIRDI 009 TaxID=714197 RepID=UPI001E46645B|nr:hypothetical protein [Nocardiopsis sp. FIRDI 009]
MTKAGAVVCHLDGLPPDTTARIGPLDLSWRGASPDVVRFGQRVSAEVIGLGPDQGRIRLSLAATENPELRAFLTSLRPGDLLSGVVADLRPFGVFVALDDGPPHPLYPGVELIKAPT